MTWTAEQNITVGPADVSPIDLGEFSIDEDQDTIWIKMTSQPSDGECVWPWSYGLLTWKTEFGRELGTVKVNGVCEGEVFRLGTGLPPSFRTGRMEFTPRSYNLQWIKLGNPWRLSFMFRSGNANAPELTTRTTLMTPYVPEVPEGNARPDYFIEDAFAYLLFNIFFK